MKFTVEEVREKLLSLTQEARQGKEIIITEGDKPLVKLVAVKPLRKAGSAKGLIEMSEDFDAPLEDFKEYME